MSNTNKVAAMANTPSLNASKSPFIHRDQRSN
jgi:hypothetical protein